MEAKLTASRIDHELETAELLRRSVRRLADHAKADERRFTQIL